MTALRIEYTFRRHDANIEFTFKMFLSTSFFSNKTYKPIWQHTNRIKFYRKYNEYFNE